MQSCQQLWYQAKIASVTVSETANLGMDITELGAMRKKQLRTGCLLEGQSGQRKEAKGWLLLLMLTAGQGVEVQLCITNMYHLLRRLYSHITAHQLNTKPQDYAYHLQGPRINAN